MNTNAALYEADFYSWCLTTAALIRDGKWADLDREALAEEIEALAARDRREVHRRFKRDLMTLPSPTLRLAYHGPITHTQRWQAVSRLGRPLSRGQQSTDAKESLCIRLP
jgi:uncharacterized protein DUF29